MRRLSTTTRMGSPSRPGSTAEAMTPIIVARITANQLSAVCGNAARSVSYQDTERSTSESPISATASTIHQGSALISACPT